MFVLNRVKASVKLIKLVKPRTLASQAHNRNIKFSQSEDDFVSINIKGESLEFPHVWLRDNCKCDKCFHKSANGRTLEWSKFNLDVKAKEVLKDEQFVKITWDDGHVSQFQLEWLKIRSFTEQNQRKYDETIYKPKKINWTKDKFCEVFTKQDYNEIIQSENALYEWLHNLAVYGVALIENTPKSENSLDKIVEKIGFPKRTHYGSKYTVTTVTNNANHVSYLTNNLQMHTDLTYYEYKPGVNMLHCYEQTQSVGGENLLSDTYFIAKYMKENYPEEYNLLTTMEVEWNDIGVENEIEYFKLHRSPVICLDRNGEVLRTDFSVPQRGSHFPGPIELVKPWYEAYSLFFHLNHEFAAKFKSKSGDIFVFDNRRVMHGRTEYEDKPGNTRKLIGAYMDWDEIYSRLRCLKIRLNK